MEVGSVDPALFAGAEYADDAAEGGGLLEEWQEVDNEAGAGVVD